MFTKHVTKELSAYCNGELTSVEAQSVLDHLHGCQRCCEEHTVIKRGVTLALQLAPTPAPADMWTDIEPLLDERSSAAAVQPRTPRLVPAFGWYRIAAVAAVILIAVAFGLIWSSYYAPRASWAVETVLGKVRIGGRGINHLGSLQVGQVVETDESSRAKVTVATIGEVELDPNSRLRLVQTRESEHRIALERGRMTATIKAPPRLFFVDTPWSEAIDLGCAYTLEVDDSGRSVLHVTSGWVELVGNGHESYVPIGAVCETRPGIGPGSPYFADATEAFVRSLEQFDFESGGQDAFSAVLREARQRDTFTLWQMLSRVEGTQRVEVLDRMIDLVGLPIGITREGTLQLDQTTLDAWKDAMDLVWF